MFDRLLRFCDTQQRVLTTALEISTRRQARQRDVHERTQAGKWGLLEGDDDDATTEEEVKIINVLLPFVHNKFLLVNIVSSMC